MLLPGCHPCLLLCHGTIVRRNRHPSCLCWWHSRGRWSAMLLLHVWKPFHEQSYGRLTRLIRRIRWAHGSRILLSLFAFNHCRHTYITSPHLTDHDDEKSSSSWTASVTNQGPALHLQRDSGSSRLVLFLLLLFRRSLATTKLAILWLVSHFHDPAFASPHTCRHLQLVFLYYYYCYYYY
jgi:hypothetical protein